MKTNVLLILLVQILICCQSIAQDSLFRAHIPQHTYRFNIIDNEIVGADVDYLVSALSDPQYIILGEYHNSPQISKLTSALIPVLHQLDFSTFALEVGPEVATILNEMTPGKVSQALQKLHMDYGVWEDKMYSTAIPFLDYEEDALFLEEALSRDWNLIGIDQEYSSGFNLIIDRLHQQLPIALQHKLNRRKKLIQDSIASYSTLGTNFTNSIYHHLSKDENYFDYLAAASIDEATSKIANNLKESLEIYKTTNVDYQYLKAFERRLRHFKTNLRDALEEGNFDLAKDKMLLKIGGLHATKGTSPFEVLDIGNTLSELAAFHDNTSLHIHIISRYSIDDGKLIDEAQDSTDAMYPILRQGQKDEWTLIDLRPFRAQTLFYPFNYKPHESIRKEILYNDIILIAPTDYYGTPLYPTQR